MELLLLRAFAEPKLFLMLILISYDCLGDGCSGPEIVGHPENASISQGSNHTFWCEGIGDFVIWEIDGVPVYKFPEDLNLEFASTETLAIDSEECTLKSSLALRSRSVSGDDTLLTFKISCLVQTHNSEHVFSDAYLNVHVIGEAGDVSLNPPASPEGSAVIKWKAPDVVFESTSPLYYNITVEDSSQTIVQATTTDTNYTINSNELSPCKMYHLTVLPFQQVSGYTQLGIRTQTDLSYSGTPLPPTDVNFSVSVQPDSAHVTIYFQVQQTDCNLQSPEKLEVTLNQYGPNGEEVLLPEQAAIREAHEYTLKAPLNLKHNYWASIKLQSNFSSSVPSVHNFSTFNVQNLTIAQQERHKLILHCDMANGAEDKHCVVKMRKQTRYTTCPTDGTIATCTLEGLPPGQYVLLAYDQEYENSTAVEKPYVISEEWKEDSENMSETGTDDTRTATALGSSPSRIEDVGQVQTEVVVGSLVSVILFIVVVLIVMVVVMVVFHKGMQNSHLKGAPDHVHVYHSAGENQYIEHSVGNTIEHSIEHNLPWQQNAVAESAYAQQNAVAEFAESAYAQPQQIVMTTTVTTNNSSNQYKQNRSEWLKHLHSEDSSVL